MSGVLGKIIKVFEIIVEMLKTLKNKFKKKLMKNANNWRRFSFQLLGSVEKIKKFDVKATRQKVVFVWCCLGVWRKGGEAPRGAGWWWGASGNEGVPLEMRGWWGASGNSGYSGNDCCAKMCLNRDFTSTILPADLIIRCLIKL